jgi:hypothetical protein
VSEKKTAAMVTERDIQVLLDVYKYRYLSVSQIQRLHFPSLQTTYRRLRALSNLGYLVGFHAPTMTEHLYYLGPQGGSEVAAALGIEPEALKWKDISRPPKDYYFLRHFLKATDFRINLTAACQDGELSLLGFIPEYHGQRTENGGLAKYIKDFVCDVRDGREQINHTPDAVFALQKHGTPALFFLEIDRGTEVITDAERGVLKACRFYLNYLLSGNYSRYVADFGVQAFRGFRALLVTTSEQRVTNIRSAVAALPFEDKAKRFIWLATYGDLDQSITAAAWRSADATDNAVYRIG